MRNSLSLTFMRILLQWSVFRLYRVAMLSIDLLSNLQSESTWETFPSSNTQMNGSDRVGIVRWKKTRSVLEAAMHCILVVVAGSASYFARESGAPARTFNLCFLRKWMPREWATPGNWNTPDIIWVSEENSAICDDRFWWKACPNETVRPAVSFSARNIRGASSLVVIHMGREGWLSYVFGFALLVIYYYKMFLFLFNLTICLSFFFSFPSLRSLSLSCMRLQYIRTRLHSSENKPSHTFVHTHRWHYDFNVSTAFIGIFFLSSYIFRNGPMMMWNRRRNNRVIGNHVGMLIMPKIRCRRVGEHRIVELSFRIRRLLVQIGVIMIRVGWDIHVGTVGNDGFDDSWIAFDRLLMTLIMTTCCCRCWWKYLAAEDCFTLLPSINNDDDHYDDNHGNETENHTECDADRTIRCGRGAGIYGRYISPFLERGRIRITTVHWAINRGSWTRLLQLLISQGIKPLNRHIAQTLSEQLHRILFGNRYPTRWTIDRHAFNLERS